MSSLKLVHIGRIRGGRFIPDDRGLLASNTNTITKEMILDTLNAALREGAYWERDERVIDECDTYERKEDGTAGAVDGCKDDLVMATAGALWLALEHMDRITLEQARRVRWRSFSYED